MMFQRSQHATQKDTPTPSPPPPPPPTENDYSPLQDATMMQKIVEMYKLLSSDAQNSNHDDSIYKVTSSLRRLRGDWMLGRWIEGITQASLAFNLWRQRSLTHRASGASVRRRAPFVLVVSFVALVVLD
jgi:hypothetical protein